MARPGPNKRESGAQPRASITFPPEVYKTIEDLAKKKKVSIAWVVRDAVDKYIADQWPLLAGLQKQREEQHGR